jgi:hypothetical protein
VCDVCVSCDEILVTWNSISSHYLPQHTMLSFIVFLTSLWLSVCSELPQDLASESDVSSPSSLVLSASDIMEIISRSGYDSMQLNENSLILTVDAISSTKCVVAVGKNDIRIYWMHSTPDALKPKAPVLVANWNKKHRFSKLYLDDDGDFVLENDLMLSLDVDINVALMTRLMKSFTSSLIALVIEMYQLALSPN